MCLEQILINLSLQVMAHLMQVHKSITTLQGEDIVFLATDINLPGKERNAKALQFCKNHITFKTNSFNRVDEGNVQFLFTFHLFPKFANFLNILSSAVYIPSHKITNFGRIPKFVLYT